MRIPISKPFMTEPDINAVARVMRSGNLAAGDQVKEFEGRWAEWQDRKHAVAVTNGTTALEAAIDALPRRAWFDHIIVPAMSFNATSSAALANGYKPIFVDIDPKTHNIAPELVRKAMTERVRAIIPVHLYGLMADMDALNDIASEWGIAIIEDAAQAHDSDIDGRRPGSWPLSIAQTYSFYATKNLTTGGEGGAITTDYGWFAEQVRLLRSHGSIEKYRHEFLGHNWRMTELQAAIGNSQMNNLGFNQQLRNMNAAALTKGISEMHNGITPPYIPKGYKHGWYQYVIQFQTLEDRNRAIGVLNSAGIGTGIHYPRPDSDQPMYSKTGSHINAWRLAYTCLSIPVGPWVTDTDVDHILETLRAL